MLKFRIWAKHFTNTFYQILFDLITRKHSTAFMTRFSLAFLNVWQAFVIVNHNYWIPNLVAPSQGLTLFIVYSVVLATLSVSTLFTQSLIIAAMMVAVNLVQYMYLSFAALWFYDPPRASAGLTLFITLICITAFWRIIISTRD